MRSVAGGYDNESVAGACRLIRISPSFHSPFIRFSPPFHSPFIRFSPPFHSPFPSHTCVPSVAAMSGTFWLWLVSLRGGKWIIFCVPCALMYFFMISAWGCVSSASASQLNPPPPSASV